MDLFDRPLVWGESSTVAEDATHRATDETGGKPCIFEQFPHDVAHVATVAETEGQRLERLLTRHDVASLATLAATPATRVNPPIIASPSRPVADVATVAGWTSGVRYLASLRDGYLPYHAASWRRLITDARAFIGEWGDAAERLGWSTMELFGTNPFATQRRYDRLGLIVLLNGRPVQTIDPVSALIGAGRDTMSYRRQPLAAGVVPLWAVREGSGW